MASGTNPFCAPDTHEPGLAQVYDGPPAAVCVSVQGVLAAVGAVPLGSAAIIGLAESWPGTPSESAKWFVFFLIWAGSTALATTFANRWLLGARTVSQRVARLAASMGLSVLVVSAWILLVASMSAPGGVVGFGLFVAFFGTFGMGALALVAQLLVEAACWLWSRSSD